MDKIFKQAKDKNVAKVIIYGHTDNLLYSDADHTKKINKSDVKDLFVKGCVVRSESENLLPVKYFETENYAGMVFKSGDSIISYYSEEYTPEPQGIAIIPINNYTTEDTGYGDGFLDITAIIPPVIDEAIFETYSAAIVAALADDSLDNINHTITIGNQTLTDQIATYDETNEIVYLGNLSLYDDSAEDTGEDWFLIVGSTLELTTRTPMTINFGMSYEVEEPVDYTWDGEAVEGDITIEDVGVLHKVSNDKLLPEDLVGGTVTFNINPETQEATPTTYTLVDDEPGAGEIAVAISEDIGFTEIGSFSSFFSGQGDLMGYTLDGTYFVKLYDSGVFITELNPPTA